MSHTNEIPPVFQTPCPDPCGQCPFSRSTSKTYLDSMGDNGTRFAAQAFGPYSLPCHMRKRGEFLQSMIGDPTAPVACSGAAIYRTNNGYDHLPASLPRLPEDKERVFASPAELLAHHYGVSLRAAELFLSARPLPVLLYLEARNHGGRVFTVPSPQ